MRRVTSYDNVYLRLMASRTAVITGLGGYVEISSLSVLDTALERGFEKTHRTKVVHEWIFSNRKPGSYD